MISGALLQQLKNIEISIANLNERLSVLEGDLKLPSPEEAEIIARQEREEQMKQIPESLWRNR